ncbi:DUF5119 domain-containing protein [uncultured Alistipes sp.]|jgi:hypothetical protein|uniref:DUF5119 domain-containing protein n=1 Tax=Alistipes TaxID=239759 RepID=UPI002666AA4C|nr:DUF5119 domain-containing protein [uncultured Alistipes sp.]
MKTKKMKKRVCTIAAAILAVLTSCEHKELCYDHTSSVAVNVIFDWRNAPDATPRSMSCYLFPTDGGKVLRYEFTNRTGGVIRVPAGRYDALCLNSDTETINYRNTEKEKSFEVTTRTTPLLSDLALLGMHLSEAPRAGDTENERVVLSPDMLWSDHAESIELERTSAPQTVTFYPKVSVCKYTVEIRNAKNLKYVSGISGSLSSLAGGLFAGKSETTEELVTIPFEVTVSADKSTLRGGLLTFGHCPSKQNRHRLIVYVILSDESKWYYTYDVTDQIHSAPDQRNVHIVLDGLPLPKPIVNGGGFHPSVDEWQSVDVDIEM